MRKACNSFTLADLHSLCDRAHRALPRRRSRCCWSLLCFREPTSSPFTASERWLAPRAPTGGCRLERVRGARACAGSDDCEPARARHGTVRGCCLVCAVPVRGSAADMTWRTAWRYAAAGGQRIRLRMGWRVAPGGMRVVVARSDAVGHGVRVSLPWRRRACGSHALPWLRQRQPTAAALLVGSGRLSKTDKFPMCSPTTLHQYYWMG